jgi:cytidylate kinase
MPKLLTIAIDGPGAVGKNVVGSLLAKKLDCHFLDTGAMYRALTWLALKLGADVSDEERLTRLASSANFTFSTGNDIFINGHNVSDEICGENVENNVSLVAKVGGVRQMLVEKQRKMVQGKRAVVIGRDIGMVVLPYADLKIFLSASPEERAHRRYRELIQKGENVSYDKVLADLEKRDAIDSERTTSPLHPADDAVVINTDSLSVEQVMDKILDIGQQRGTDL